MMITKKPTNKKTKVTEIIKPDSERYKWLEDYQDHFTFDIKPISEGGLHKMAVELANWAENNPEALTIGQFVRKRGIPRDTYNNWVNKYPVLKRAHEAAMWAIGDRRELAGLRREFDVSMVKFMMPNYDPEWMNMLKVQSQLKADVLGVTGMRVVEIPAFPDTCIVDVQE